MHPHSVIRFAIIILLNVCSVITGEAQKAQFSADKTSGCFPVTINFINTSTNATSYSWTFGNGNTSQVANPSAIYTEPGTYTVSLTAFNGAASDTETKTGFIVIHDYPQVDFSFDKNSGCTPLQINFTSIIGGGATISNWQWIFGDGGTSDVANPTYIYNQPGNPSISLKAKNQFGCETTTTKQSVININGPTVNFTPSATTVCQVPALIQFTNQSTGNGALTHQWNFGDGTTSTQVSPSHNYTQPGNFTVRLVTTDGAGCMAAREISVNVGSEGGLSFQPSAMKVCKGQSVTFNVQHADPILSSTWNFGNGTTSANLNQSVTYAQSGIYQVTLTAQLEGRSCQSIASATVEVVADASPSFTHSLNCSNALTLKSTSTNSQRIEWSVGGIVISTAQNFTYNSGAGDVTVTLTAYNGFNCANALVRVIQVPALPSASFDPSLEQDCTLPSLSGCAPFQITFTNRSSAGLPFVSAWTLGEGVTSSNSNPTRTFNNPGDFKVQLKITDSRGCVDSTLAMVHVANVQPQANFSTDKMQVCVGEAINFTSTSTNANFLCWDFGDGSIVNGSNPTHAYATPGIYTPKLTAKNDGCTSNFVAPQIVVKDPLVAFEITKSCDDPYLVQFSDRSVNADEREWNLGDGTIVNSLTNFSHRFASTGNYQVTLTGENHTTQCVVEVAQSLIIQDIKAQFSLASETPCRFNPTETTNTSEFAASHLWLIDNVFTSVAQEPLLTFTTAGSHNVTLRVTDSDGCTDETFLLINVPDITGNFNFQATSDCQNFSVAFNDLSTASPPIQTWNWNFGDGSFSTDQDPFHVYHEKDSFDITLQLTNADGNCSFTIRDAVVFSIPQIEFSTAKRDYCLDEPVYFVNQSINATTFAWFFDNGNQSLAINPVSSYHEAGLYDITLEASDQYGCTQSLTRPDYISVAPPKAGFDAFQTSGECPPLTTIFKSTATGYQLKYNWDFGNGTGSVLPDPACTYTKAGVFDVKLKVTDGFGCTDTKLVEDLISVGGPSGRFDFDIGNSCVNADVFYHADANNTVIYQWDFGDGNVTTGSDATAYHRYQLPNQYRPSLVLIDQKDCHVVADGSRTITVHDSTAVEFTYSPKCIFNGEPLFAAATNSLNQKHEWFINDQLVSEGVEFSITLDSASLYQVELRAKNEFECISSSKQEIKIHGRIDFIPNVITPNGDSNNEFFVIPGVEDSDWRLQVFNRWGREVYSRSSYLNNWQANNIAAGFYYFYLNNQVCNDRSYKGLLNVLK